MTIQAEQHEINLVTDNILDITGNIDFSSVKDVVIEYDAKINNIWGQIAPSSNSKLSVELYSDRSFGWSKNASILITNAKSSYRSNSVKMYKPKLNFSTIELVSDDVVYAENNHSAFTDLVCYQGNLYMSFREGKRHAPQSEDEYGDIIILKLVNEKWEFYNRLHKSGFDLRDPKLYIFNGKLCVLCGCSQLVDSKLTKQGTCISIMTEDGFTDPLIVNTDVNHKVWIWRMTVQGDVVYGIGYMEGYYPVLLRTHDLQNWETISMIPIEGVPTEADVVAYNNELITIVRRDGDTAFLCKYSIDENKWQCIDMGMRFESPCIGYIDSDVIIASGRIFDNGNRETGIIRYYYNTNVVDILDKTTAQSIDCAYPGIIVQDQFVHLSYYEGIHTNSRIHYRKFKLNK